MKPGAPTYIWINLLIASAILRSLHGGRLHKVITGYRLIAMIVIALVSLPFIVDQARTAIYPQLEFNNLNAMPYNYTHENNNFIVESPASLTADKMVRTAQDAIMPGSYSEAMIAESKLRGMTSIDPDAMIQTGPGLPAWTLHQYHINWDGPVRHDQTISMTLLSPGSSALLNLLRIGLLLLLAWRLFDVASFKIPKLPVGAAAKTIFVLFVTGSLFNLSPNTAEASNYPPKELLAELQQELMKAPDCLPRCADIEKMTITLSEKNLKVSLLMHAQEDALVPLPVPIKQWSPSIISVDGKRTVKLYGMDSTLWILLNKGTHTVTMSGQVESINQLKFSFPLKPRHIELNIDGWTTQGADTQTYKINALSFLRIDKTNQHSTSNKIEQKEIPVYAKVDRFIDLGLEWFVNTKVKGITGSAYPVILNIPLLEGESVVTDNIKVVDGHGVITLNNARQLVQWTSKMSIATEINLQSSEQDGFIERWVLNASPIWRVSYDGIHAIYHQNKSNQWQPEWRPWPGEKVTITVSRPAGIKGGTITIDSSALTLTPGEKITTASLEFNLRSSQGGQHVVKIPDNGELLSVSINKQPIPVRKTKEGISLPLSPGEMHVNIQWRESRGITTSYHSSVIDLGADSVNHSLKIKPGSRWVLFTSGPLMGPAVLFWSVFGVMLLLAIALGRVKGTPLNSVQWLLLAMGLSISTPWAVIIIAICIFALKARGSLVTENTSRRKFNTIQIVLVGLMFVAISTLISAIKQGLLGSPDMQIVGNGSYSYQLNWFSDRISHIPPDAVVISAPIFVYRIMMLIWSIWLAFALIKWAQWGWSNFTKEEYWRHIAKKTDDGETNNSNNIKEG
jgi:hypothetical protein